MPEHTEHRNRSRTEAAILDAFIALACDRRCAAIRVNDLIDRAGIGRSTFYEHFRRKDDVLLVALDPLLSALATAASGRAAPTYVRQMVDHLWQRRALVRPLLDSSAAPTIQRHLADAIAGHGAGTAPTTDASLGATGIAAAQLAMLRCKLAGQVTATIDEMTNRLMACSRLRDRDKPG